MPFQVGNDTWPPYYNHVTVIFAGRRLEPNKNHTTRRLCVPDCEFAEVLVSGEDHARFAYCHCQYIFIRRTRRGGFHREYVMPFTPEPIDQLGVEILVSA